MCCLNKEFYINRVVGLVLASSHYFGLWLDTTFISMEVSLLWQNTTFIRKGSFLSITLGPDNKLIRNGSSLVMRAGQYIY